MTQKKRTYDELKSIESLSRYKGKKALQLLGQLIDEAWDKADQEGIRKAQKLAEELASRRLSGKLQATLNYFRANSWAALRDALERKKSHDWEHPEAEQEIFYLRKALNSKDFSQLEPGWQIQILTNLAGRMSEFGRPIEAIAYWDQALKIAPSFGMALGNRGIGLKKVAQHLYDHGHAHIYLSLACKDLERSLIDRNTYEDAKRHFKAHYDQISRFRNHSSTPKNADKYSIGKSKQEQAYRKWCLEERLFLNPLNDVLQKPIVAQDVFSMPSLTTKKAQPPPFFGFFNQLKQEYVSARFIYFDSISRSGVHFSDRNVQLYNTLDYPFYGLSGEQMKLAFRSAYSLLDKVAYFIRHYFDLDINERSVYFRSVWYKGGSRNAGLNPQLTERQNLPLRGLFWLSKDIFQDNEDFKTVLEPEAQQLHEIRNHLEHKYLKLHDDLWSAKLRNSAAFKDRRDTLSFPLTFSELEGKTLRVLRIARAALTYLSLAVHREERKKIKKPGRAVTLQMSKWQDNWKRRL